MPASALGAFPSVASPAARVLLVLLAVDTALVMLHVAFGAGFLSDPLFAITRERGLGEMVQYAKAAGSAALLLRVFRDTRAFTALVWSVGLLAILLDDALAIHERVGARIGPLLFPAGPGRLAPDHLAELIFLGGGAALFAAAATAAASREGARGWAITGALGGALGLLVLFGVLVDALHSMTVDRTARRLLAIVEDGGEMAAMSAMAAIAWALRVQARASRST